jgi:GTP-binding protein EngB required for normal cell division
MALTGHNLERRSIDELLHVLLNVSVTFGPPIAREKLLSVEEKLATGALHLAVLGQVKRGKSSLINALLEEPVLPTGVLPVTAIITEIRYGHIPEATVIYSTGDFRKIIPLSELPDYITESGNPGNTKQVESVEVAYPSPLLESGIVLIDTPGIGSTHTHNTRTTQHYLDRVDAGIVVLSVDPPITEVESRFIRSLKIDVPKLFFVLNKTDLFSTQEVSEIRCFLEIELARVKITSPEIFPLSAVCAGHNTSRGSSTPMPDGLDTFVQRLKIFLFEEKQRALADSAARDVLAIASTLRFASAIGARAEGMSTEELKNKRLALYGAFQQAEDETQEMHVLLRQQFADVLAEVEYDVAAYAAEAIPEVQRNLDQFQREHPQETGRLFGVLLEDFLLREVQVVFRKWQIQEDEKVQQKLDFLADRFSNQTSRILDRLERVADSLFETHVKHVSVSCTLRVESHMRYRVEHVFHSLDRFLLLLPHFLQRRIVLRKTQRTIPLLLDMNAGRIRFDYIERLQSSFDPFENELRNSVAIMVTSLRKAIEMPRTETAEFTDTVKILDDVLNETSLLISQGAVR